MGSGESDRDRLVAESDGQKVLLCDVALLLLSTSYASARLKLLTILETTLLSYL